MPAVPRTLWLLPALAGSVMTFIAAPQANAQAAALEPSAPTTTEAVAAETGNGDDTTAPEASASAAVLLSEGEALLKAGDAPTAKAQATWLLRRGALAATDHARTYVLLAGAHRALGEVEPAARAEAVAHFIVAQSNPAQPRADNEAALIATYDGSESLAAGLVVQLVHDPYALITGFRIDAGNVVHPLSAQTPVVHLAKAEVPPGANIVIAVDAAGSAVARARLAAPGTGPHGGPAARANGSSSMRDASDSGNASALLETEASKTSPAPTAPAPVRDGEPTWRDRLLAPWAVVPLLSAAAALVGAGLFASGAMGYGAMAADNPAAPTFVPVFIGLMIGGGAAFAGAVALAVGGAAYNLFADALTSSDAETAPLPDAGSTAPLPDAASSSPDAASPSPDAASPSPDAASPSPDAASPSPDAASPDDDQSSGAVKRPDSVSSASGAGRAKK